MNFEEAFRRALLNSTDRLLNCMELLWIQGDYVNLDLLDNSAQQVMGHFSTKVQQHWNNSVTKDLYLCVRMNGNIVEAYRLRNQLRGIVEDVLTQMGRL